MCWIVVGILLFFVELVWDVVTDSRKGQIDHKKEEKVRSWFLFPSYVCLCIPLKWYFLLIPIPLELAWYWFLFDGLYGLSKKKGWWWTGTEDGEQDANSDNFLQRLKPWQHKSLKISLIVITLVGYVLAVKYSR